MFTRRSLWKIGALGALSVGGVTALSTQKVRAAEKLVEPTKSKPNDIEAARNNISLPTSPPSKWNFNWDHRDPESLVKKKDLKEAELKEGPEGVKKLLKSKASKASRHILLIRHGQYNLAGKTDAENVLTQLGREQARQTGRRLLKSGLVFDRLIYSTLTRATETANLIMEELGDDKVLSKKAENLIEEGAPYPVEPPVAHWDIPLREVIADGTRIEAGFRRYFHRAEPEQEKDSYELMVCHGNVTRYYLMRALQFPPEAWLRLSKAHASITWITIRPNGRVLLRGFGDSGHLPQDLVTFS